MISPILLMMGRSSNLLAYNTNVAYSEGFSLKDSAPYFVIVDPFTYRLGSTTLIVHMYLWFSEPLVLYGKLASITTA